MKKSYFLLLIFLLTMFIHRVDIFGQVEQNILQKGTTPERAAEGRTKWMSRGLSLHEFTSREVYRINLKYLLKIDSLRLTCTDSAGKNEKYLFLSQRRDNELKNILASDIYDKYLLMIEAIKAKRTGEKID